MKLQKVIYLFDYAKLVWTDVHPGDVHVKRIWVFEGYCFNKHVRELTTVPPSDKNAQYMIQRHFGQFGSPVLGKRKRK